jgi:hypothetical protein
MKWKGWIGGMLLVMMLFGTLGCGKKRGPVTGGMVDGPGMMYTPEDQSPFAGKWQSRDGTVVMEVESSDPFESSRIHRRPRRGAVPPAMQRMRAAAVPAAAWRSR